MLPPESVGRTASSLIEALRSCSRPSAAPLASGLLRIALLPPKGFERASQIDSALGARGLCAGNPFTPSIIYIPPPQRSLHGHSIRAVPPPPSSSSSFSPSHAHAHAGAVLPLLDEQDAIAGAAVAIAGELVARQGGAAALSVVTDRLAAPEAAVRRNALDVLAEALARGASVGGRSPAGSGISEAAVGATPAGLGQLLGDRILPCLSDADLGVRKAAAALLGAPPPVIQTTCSFCPHSI